MYRWEQASGTMYRAIESARVPRRSSKQEDVATTARVQSWTHEPILVIRRPRRQGGEDRLVSLAQKGRYGAILFPGCPVRSARYEIAKGAVTGNDVNDLVPFLP
jgi:hypothetical protein